MAIERALAQIRTQHEAQGEQTSVRDTNYYLSTLPREAHEDTPNVSYHVVVGRDSTGQPVIILRNDAYQPNTFVTLGIWNAYILWIVLSLSHST